VTQSNQRPVARAWADVDLGAILANAKTVASVSQRRLLPMVKADGYGVGAVEAARALESLDPWGYGVATLVEGAELRSAGISRPIVVFSPLLAGDIDGFLRHDLRPAIGDLPALEAWTGTTDRPFHLEIDTGMARAGLQWHDTARVATALRVAAAAPGWEGVFTHFHSADTDSTATSTQWERFQHVLADLPRRPALIHAANSAAALEGERYAGDMVRPGIFLYGGAVGGHEPSVVVRLRAPVVSLRTIRAGDTVSYGATWTAGETTEIATLGVGYADGVHRVLGGRTEVELGKARRPVVGRVNMDLTMVAVPRGTVMLGDVATIYGGLVSLNEQADRAGTISYELLTALGGRVPRFYR
jgi:alanine racemase